MPDVPLCFPVWNYAHLADPYMASIRRIHKTCAKDPARESVLVGSVFRLAHVAAQAAWQTPKAEHLPETANA